MIVKTLKQNVSLKTYSMLYFQQYVVHWRYEFVFIIFAILSRNMIFV